MARKKQKGNGTTTVYPRKNKAGQITEYRGSYVTLEDRTVRPVDSLLQGGRHGTARGTPSGPP